MTDEIQELKSRIDSLQDKAKNLNDKARRLAVELAQKVCPFSIGDIVGDNGTNWQITEIIPMSYGDRYKLRGARLKKDGTAGKVVGHIYGWGKIKLIESASK